MRTRVICLGNAVMSDDGAAIHVAQELRRRTEGQPPTFDLIESSVAGYDLLELMDGWERVIFVEAVKLPEREPGELVRLDPLRNAKQLRLCSMREASIAEILEAGPKIGRSMPTEVVLLGLQGEDLCTFGRSLSPAVAAAVPRAADEVMTAVGAG